MQTLVVLLVVVLFIFNIIWSTTTAYSKNKLSVGEIQLIEEAASLFAEDDPLVGYEEALRRYNDTEDATLFMTIHMPDHVIRYNGSLDDNQEIVIFHGESDVTNTVKVPFKDVHTYIVLRHKPGTLHRYTMHLAYVR